MIKVGIFFGGRSREREVSFAGGRTVYDNLDKRMFEAVPIFVDEKGNFTRLNWPFIYRGTIRDFYPPVKYLPPSENKFQVYADSLDLDKDETLDSLRLIGEPIIPEQFSALMDIAFLALHGAGGEDGSIQGLLEWYGIPYTGSGILPSALGMNKAIQKRFQDTAFDVPKFISIEKRGWLSDSSAYYARATEKIGFPMVIKPANQGSSIGVSILKQANVLEFHKAVDLAFFKVELSQTDWERTDKIQWVRQICDIRDGLGLPLMVNGERILHPEILFKRLNVLFKNNKTVFLEADHSETEVVIEQFISGKEFSCIVISDENGEPLALPPTEIVKGKDLFDYKSKYLPGLSRKVTPIQIPDAEISRIRESCETLYRYFSFDVYARIDGFYNEQGKIFLNDPNTTSGMMPSSFFFHQAAEIGLNPSQFLTFIIRNSLRARKEKGMISSILPGLLSRLDEKLNNLSVAPDHRIGVAVIMGGYSTERHISIESGRNIYEKLSSSPKYRPIPVFLTGNETEHELYILPIQVLLKDNADDIRQKVEHFSRVAILDRIEKKAEMITRKYAPNTMGFEPKKISYEKLPELCSAVFIALHGRPGEDGAVQKHLEAVGLPYNGSGIESSQVTINKFETNRILREKGFLVADSALIHRADWNLHNIQLLGHLTFPLIAKPADEGCSSAVVKLKNEAMLNAYADLTFRTTAEKDPRLCAILNIDVKDEFPQKDYFLLEDFIDREGALHFLEITGGMLTKYDAAGELTYQIFEASEALAEGEILSLAEKFLAGEGQNITPARYASNPKDGAAISAQVKAVFEAVARTLNVQGYCRIDAFVRIFEQNKADVIIIEINSLPGMTPATCIYHQAAIEGMKPYEFIDSILTFGMQKQQLKSGQA